MPDEGGLADSGPYGSYRQSARGDVYEAALERLKATGLCYPCVCTRADIMATQAPHQSDGRVVYAGTCRPEVMPSPWHDADRPAAVRLAVGDAEISFVDGTYGPQTVRLAEHCGDFILRRADGAWAYQLAVVVDDAAMGVTSVVRGSDLLLSAAQQIYLYRLLGCEPPAFTHIPLLCRPDGRRLSKRDASLSMAELRRRYTAEEILGRLAYLAGIIPEATPLTASAILPHYTRPLPATLTLPISEA